jgi:hypothetical protein
VGPGLAHPDLGNELAGQPGLLGNVLLSCAGRAIGGILSMIVAVENEK